jgi:DNA-binding transcriptional regulator YdaS (Cro superfamily)
MADDAPDTLKPTRLAEALGISLPYASQLLGGTRPITTPLAVRIYRATGHKLGPISQATDAEIDVVERFSGAAA